VNVNTYQGFASTGVVADVIRNTTRMSGGVSMAHSTYVLFALVDCEVLSSDVEEELMTWTESAVRLFPEPLNSTITVSFTAADVLPVHCVSLFVVIS